jgi:hypothetical protein
MVVALALTVVAGGCGKEAKPDQPVAFGAPPPVTAKLAITAPADDVVPAASWPSACQFLTDEEIKAVLPQATDIKRVPQGVSIVSISDKSQTSVAPEGSCSYKFGLERAAIKEAVSSLIVTIDAVADPKIIKEHYTETRTAESKRDDRKQFENHSDLGPDDCYSWLYATSEFHLVCRQGPMMFEIRGGGSGSFTGVANGDLTARARVWLEKAQTPAAKIIAAKVPR